MAERVRGERDFAAEIVAEIKKGEIPVSGDQKNFQYLVDALETAVHQHWLIKEGDKYKATEGKWKDKGEQIIKALLEREDTRPLVVSGTEVAEPKEKTSGSRPKRRTPAQIVADIRFENERALESYKQIPGLEERRAANRAEYEEKEIAGSTPKELPQPSKEKVAGPSQLILEEEPRRSARFEISGKGEVEDRDNFEVRLAGIDKELAGINETLASLRKNQMDLKKLIERAKANRSNLRKEFNSRKPSTSVEIDKINFLDLLDKIGEVDQFILNSETEYTQIELAIENEKFQRVGLENEQKRLRSKIALSELGVEAADFEGNIPDLIRAINSVDATPGEVLDLLSHMALTQEEIGLLADLGVKENLQFSARTSREREALLGISERLRKKSNEEFFLNSGEFLDLSLEEKYKRLNSKDTNTTTFLQIAGIPEDVRNVEGMIQGSHQIIEVNSNGEIVALNEEGEVGLNKLRNEIKERVTLEYKEELLVSAKEALENNPLIKAAEVEIVRLGESIKDMERRFPFNIKGNRLAVMIWNHDKIEQYDTLTKMHDNLLKRIDNLELAIAVFKNNRAKTMESFVEAKLRLSETMEGFNPVNPEMERISTLLETIDSVWPLETYSSYESRYLARKVGEKINFKIEELNTPPSLEVMKESVDEGEKARLEKELVNNLTPRIAKIISRRVRGVNNQELQSKIMKIAFASDEFKGILKEVITSKGVALKLEEIGSIQNSEEMDINITRELLNDIYRIDIQKGNKEIKFLQFVEELTLKYKFHMTTAKILGAENPVELVDRSNKEIALAGRNAISDVLKKVGVAHHSIISGFYSVSDFGSSLGESYNEMKLEQAGYNKATFEQKMVYSEKRLQLKKKNERQKGILSDLFSSFFGGSN